MKLQKHIILLLAAFTLGFTACKKSGTSGGGGTDGGKIQEGNPASITLKIKQAKGVLTYTTDDPNSTDAEATVNRVDVFIFDNGAPYGLIHRSFTAAADIYVDPLDIPNSGLKPLSLTDVRTGVKRIYVGINLTATVVNKLVDNYSYITDGISFNAGAITDRLWTHLVTPTAGTANDGTIAMFNTYDYDNPTAMLQNIYTIVDGGANTFTINVSRMVAKVAVKVDPAFSATIPGGVLSSLRFTAGATNNRLQLAPLRQFRDGNWASFSAGDFNLNADDVGFQPYTNGVINLANDDWTTDFDFEDAATPKIYIPENTSELHRHGDVSYVSLRAVFTPTDDGEPAGFGTSPSDQTAFVTGTTFYAVFSNDVGTTGTPPTGIAVHYFKVQADADAFATAHSGVRFTYTNGQCYYRIYLNPAGDGTTTGNPYDVLRNVFYKVNIKRINTIGNPLPDQIPGSTGTPAFPGGGVVAENAAITGTTVITAPVSEDITTTITIADWNDQEEDYEF